MKEKPPQKYLIGVKSIGTIIESCKFTNDIIKADKLITSDQYFEGEDFDMSKIDVADYWVSSQIALSMFSQMKKIAVIVKNNFSSEEIALAERYNYKVIYINAEVPEEKVEQSSMPEEQKKNLINQIKAKLGI